MSTTSKAAPKTGHKHPPTTREQRGIELYREGAVSERGDLFVVRGGSRKYTVSLDRETCTCPDFGKRRETCKHLFAVVVYAAKKRCRRAARPADRPQRRHGERTERPRDDRAGDGRGSGPARRRDVAGGLDSAWIRANVERMSS